MTDSAALPFSVGLVHPGESPPDLGIAGRVGSMFGAEALQPGVALRPSRTRLFDFFFDQPGAVRDAFPPYRSEVLQSNCPIWLASGTRAADEVMDAGLAFVPPGQHLGVVHALLDMLDYGGIMTGITIDDIQALVRARRLLAYELVGDSAPALIAQLADLLHPGKTPEPAACLVLCRGTTRTAGEFVGAVETQWPEAALELQIRDPAPGQSWGATLIFAFAE